MCCKKIIGVAVAACVLVSGVFAGGRKAESGGLTIKPGVLMVGMEIGYPPLEYYAADGVTPAGFDVELAKALAAQLGLKAEFVDTAWDGIFAGVQTGKYDCIMSSVTITPERRETLTFTRPYIGNAMTIVVAKNSPIRISRPEDIGGHRVTYQAETTADIYATQIAASGVRFDAFEYDKVMNCFDELKLGRVDLIVVDSLVASEYLDRGPNDFQIAWQGPADEQFGIVLKKGNDALAAELDRALGALFTDGTIQKISNDIFHMDLVSSLN
ncbi:MAG: ABC transporter substrate-binding protein [Spirochaetaceae bacterium]|jgi:polar amino acid transport system substrate-binding protein|nr:ABC transporter substrate-binding protein [Spirochaetaceae bacterium]